MNSAHKFNLRNRKILTGNDEGSKTASAKYGTNAHETTDLCHETIGHKNTRDGNEKHQISSLTWMLLLLIFYASIYYVHIYTYEKLPAPKKMADSLPTDFIEESARNHLDNFMRLGGRPAGMVENDIYSVKYILDSVSQIQKIAHSSRNIEVDVQRPTGSFTLAFLDDFTSYYANISNTVVRVSSPHSSDQALLLNCHTDSAINGPGASDDAVACAIMLEILRSIAVDNTPLLHPLIFLFNGAEENILQASHGFITQHKWAKQVQTFINLEAAGAGGKELVFQTGPENSWLVWAWGKNAPYPHGSSVAQDLFQSGLIPSDTDFRIYRDYGKIPGIDLAYIQNGYVYHTLHDTADKIPAGCVQRSGENILGVVRHLVQSPDSLLPDPSAYRHGEAAFFDLLGPVFVIIPLRLLIIINYLTLIAVMIFISRRAMNSSDTGLSAVGYISTVLKSSAVNVMGYIACLICLACVATVLTLSGHSKSWFTQHWLIFGLYFPAGLIGLVTAHVVAKKTIFKGKDQRVIESVNFDTVLLEWAMWLYVTRNIGSSYIVLIFVVPGLLGRGLIAKNYFGHKSKCNSGLTPYVVQLSILLLPSLMWFYKGWIAFKFFIPITGRSGTTAPPEVFMVGLVGFYTVSCFSFQVSRVYLVNSLKWFYVTLSAILVCSFIVAFSDVGFPYKSDDNFPTPKRFFAQHISREFFDTNGILENSDSGIFIPHLDYLGNDIDLGPDKLKDAKPHTCQGAYCEMPYAIPIQSLARKCLYIPEPRPPSSVTTELYPFDVTWQKEFMTSKDGEKHVKISVSVNGPPHMAVHITPMTTGPTFSTLVDWSFNGDVKLAKSKHSETYFIYYGGGVVHPTWDFWLQFAVTKAAVEGGDDRVLDLAVTGHWIPSGPVSRVNNQTTELKTMMSQLKEWVAPMGWLSLYRKYKI